MPQTGRMMCILWKPFQSIIPGAIIVGRKVGWQASCMWAIITQLSRPFVYVVVNR